MNKNHVCKFTVILLTTCLLSLSCSSAPKRAMEINTIQTLCTTTLENANSNILNGNYDKAKTLLSQASNLALSIDNYDMMISTQLAYVSLFLSHNPPDSESAMDHYLEAQEFVPFSNNPDRNKALCSIAKTRIAISTNSISLNYDSLIKELSNTQKEFSKDPFNQAQCFSILGDLYRIKHDYTKAEKAYSDAVKQFTNERYLSEIGITWYKIAQNRSLSGNKKGALEALNKAIYYDRCAENSMALGSDYYIKGVILLKGKATETERIEAKTALKHSANIFDACGNVDMANRSLSVIESEGL